MAEDKKLISSYKRNLDAVDRIMRKIWKKEMSKGPSKVPQFYSKLQKKK